ncbi:hypothetical protein ACWZHB_18810 [Nocardia sp. FBN12]|uniref:hypothetical protein n=1 Tax=Nocardia sp. FBN12 TaxID=3419766 RepID=UPI003D012084
MARNALSTCRWWHTPPTPPPSARIDAPGRGPAASTSTSLAALRATLGDRYVRRLCVAVFFPFGTFVALATFGQALLEPSGVSADAASIVRW